MSFLKTHFNLRSLKTKGLTLLIEHAPCCILSVAAGFIGLPLLAHNAVLELGFALGGAVTGEYIGHRLFHRAKPCGAGRAWRRYGLALAFGLASWGVHQAFFHKDKGHQDGHHRHEHRPPPAAAEVDGKTAVFQR